MQISAEYDPNELQAQFADMDKTIGAALNTAVTDSVAAVEKLTKYITGDFEIMIDKTFNFGSFTGTLDMSNKNDIARWENAAEQFEKDRAEADRAEKVSEKFDLTLNGMTRLFDTILGDGASALILNGSESLDIAFEAFLALCSFVEAQRQEFETRQQAIRDKYNPRLRAAARDAKKQG